MLDQVVMQQYLRACRFLCHSTLGRTSLWPQPIRTIKHVEPVLKSSDVLTRIFTLAPGDTIPWHYHQHSADHFFVLEGGAFDLNTRTCGDKKALGRTKP